jgi:hypothetical protein
MQFRLLPLVAVLALVSLVTMTSGTPDASANAKLPRTQIEKPPVVPANKNAEMAGLDDMADFQSTTEEGDLEEEDITDYDEDLEEVTDEELDQTAGEDEAEIDLTDDNKPFDVDYIVDRPTDNDEDDYEDDDESNEDDDDEIDDRPVCGKVEEDVEGDLDCRPPEKNWRPYATYKGYKTWQRQPLFVIIIGGLRWDYLNGEALNMTETEKNSLKAFSWIKKHGTTMKQVIPVYPPLDLPTWTSLATGLYPGTTGVLGDYMYDLKTRKLYSKHQSLEGWWIKGEPIWSVAAKHNRKVSVLNWHDCALPGTSIENPSDCKPFNPRAPLPTKQKLTMLFNQAFTKIHAGGYDLSIVYTDALKKTALSYGPNSREVADQLMIIDDVLQGRLSDIKNKKERANLKLNILLLSDYGLAGKENTTKYVLDDYIEFEHVQYIIQRGGSVVLVPYALKAGGLMKGVAGKIGLEAMPGVDAYVREQNLAEPPIDQPTIPEDLHYAGYSWTQDILVIAMPGFEIEIIEGGDKLLPPMNLDMEMGTSAYNPQPKPPHIVPGRDKHKSKELRAQEKMKVELYDSFAHMMKTVGFAWGPDFKTGHTTEPLEIVDIYQLMAFLLQVDPNPHDGAWDRVKGMLMLSGAESSTSLPILMLTLAASLLTL